MTILTTGHDELTFIPPRLRPLAGHIRDEDHFGLLADCCDVVTKVHHVPDVLFQSWGRGAGAAWAAAWRRARLARERAKELGIANEEEGE